VAAATQSSTQGPGLPRQPTAHLPAPEFGVLGHGGACPHGQSNGSTLAGAMDRVSPGQDGVGASSSRVGTTWERATASLGEVVRDQGTAPGERFTRANGRAKALAERFTRVNGRARALAERCKRANGRARALAERFTRANGRAKALAERFARANGRARHSPSDSDLHPGGNSALETRRAVPGSEACRRLAHRVRGPGRGS